MVYTPWSNNPYRYELPNERTKNMSENTPKTRQVTPLPDTMKITQALATISDLEVNIVFIKREQTALARELREMTAKLNRLKLVLEAK